MAVNGCKWLIPLGFLVLAGGAGAAPLQTHRAVYDLTLGRTEAASDIAGIDGRMVIEWRGGPGCGGYTSLQRVVTRVTGLDQSYMSNDIRLSYFEKIDGREFSYTRTEYTNGESTDRDDGVATRGDDGTIELSREEGKTLKLPASVLFPVQYHNALVEHAERGERIFELTLFDGTEERETPTTIFVSKQPDAGSDVLPDVKGVEALKSVAHWPVRVSYFDTANSEGLPNFEMGITLFENGIATGMTLDYIDLEIKARLKELVIFDDGTC